MPTKTVPTPRVAPAFRPLLACLLGLSSLFPSSGWSQAQSNDGGAAVVKVPPSIYLSVSADARPIPIRPARIPTEVRVSDQLPRCVSTAFQTPGQAWSAGLSSGGITLGAGSVAAQTTTPQHRGTLLRLNRPVQPGQVTLLVIDDFQPVPVELDEDGPNTGQPPITYQLRHGELVLAHIRSLLQGGGFTVGPDQATRGGRTIVFRKLDLSTLTAGPGGVPTTQIARAVEVFQKRERSEREGGALVVNMSFALIPCNLQALYGQFRDEALRQTPPLRLTFTDFLKAVADANLPSAPKPTAAQEQTYLVNLFTHLTASDPLLTTLRGLLRNQPALAAASSGNYAQSFETMPAAWPPDGLSGPPVLGVGATDRREYPQTWPDQADVLEVGQWFRFPSLPPQVGCFVGPGCIFAAMPAGTQPSAANFAYRGTSFSSPTVAAALASRIPLSLGAVKANDPCFMIDSAGYLRLRGGAAPMPKLNNVQFRPLFARCR